MNPQDPVVITPPSLEEWRQFVSRLLLALGTTLSLAGVIFFFAYNWQDLGRFSKLGLLASGVAIAALSARHLGLDRLTGQVALTAASVLVGALIAVYGQIYQTGADAWENFFLWALLILPWTFLARFPVLWLLQVTLCNLSLILLWSQLWPRADESIPTLAVAVLNGMAWAAWEICRRRGAAWLGAGLGPRLLACATLFPLIGLVLSLIWEWGPPEPAQWIGLVALVALVAFMLRHYLRVDPHLFMLAGALASVVTVLTTGLSEWLELFHGESALAFLGLGLFLIGQISASTWWLRHVAREMEVQP